MTELVWFDLYPPRGLDLTAVTNLIRPLGSRPRYGLMQRTPVVVCEAWVRPGQVRWLLGADQRLTATLPDQLRAAVPGLGVFSSSAPARPTPVLAAEVRLTSFAFPLRLDTATSVSAGVLATANLLRGSESVVLQWVVGPSHQRAQRPDKFDLAEALGLRKPTPPTTTEQQAWRHKTAEPLFGIRGRVGASAASPQRAVLLIRSLVGALSLASSSHCHVRATLSTARRAHDLARAHGPAATWSSVASGAELAVLLGWPIGDTRVPGRGPMLAPAPRQLLISSGQTDKQTGQRILGASLHPADQGQLVTMPLATSIHNVHITGPTGSGKSTTLAQFILADAEAGHGVLSIAPTDDLSREVLSRLPAHRHDDVVVVNPADDDQVSINPLAGPVGEAERRADELVSLFRALYGPAIGPRTSDVLLHGLLTATRLPDGTLADVPILLSSPSFRRRALASVSDPLVLSRWWAWFESTSVAEQQQIVAPAANKLRAFLSRQSIRRMLGQPRPGFSFDELFTGRPRVVLVNLNRGLIGSEAARLLGSLLLQSAWAAAQRRAALPCAKRFPVMLVIDEFQDYIGALDFGEVLAQCRGLSVSVTAAHQHLSQLDTQLRASVFANARSRLSFRPSADDIRPLAAAFGEPVTPDDLAGLGAFQACARLLVDSTMTPPFVVQTLPLPPATTDPDALRRASRQRYATDGSALDEALVRRWYSDDSPPDAPIGTRPRRSS